MAKAAAPTHSPRCRTGRRKGRKGECRGGLIGRDEATENVRFSRSSFRSGPLAFQAHGQAPEALVVQEQTKRFHPDISFADMLMAVDPGVKFFLRVVEMKGGEAVDAYRSSNSAKVRS